MYGMTTASKARARREPRGTNPNTDDRVEDNIEVRRELGHEVRDHNKLDTTSKFL